MVVEPYAFSDHSRLEKLDLPTEIFNIKTKLQANVFTYPKKLK